MIIHPTKNLVLVRLAKETLKYLDSPLIKSPGHLKFIPEGEVRAVGPDVTKVSVGQRVVIEYESGLRVSDGERDYILYPEDELIAIMEKESGE